MTNYQNKYTLTKEQSLFLAKKKWDENIYCGMKMESRAITFPQTQTILNGVNVPSVKLEDIQAVLNMRDAWKYLTATIGQPFSFDMLCKINGYIARNEALAWGTLRTGTVGISGTNYIPKIPQEDEVEAQLALILTQQTSATETALDLFLWGTRSQLFWDGNKRTSLTAANKILLEGGAGMLTIKESNMAEFNELLCAFYNTGDGALLKSFLYNHCIDGIEIPTLVNNQPCHGYEER